MFDSIILNILILAAALFIAVIALAVIYVMFLYLADVTQTKKTIRRNFPVLGKVRNSYEYMSEFFRQCFFSIDREEMPFNRAERFWVYRAAKNVNSTFAFSSKPSLTHSGEVMFIDTPFPTFNDPQGSKHQDIKEV